MSNFHLYPYIDISGNSNFISYNSNINDKSLISIYWNDIIDKPSFCNISTTNNYNDLNNKTWNNILLNSYTDKLIGIGTNNPLYNLDINGSINLTGTLNKNKSPYQNSQWITENSNIYFNNGSISIGSSTINDNFNINGNIKINGNIISSNNDLGTSNYKWRHLYLSSNSIYIDNISISKSDSNYVKINSIVINEIYLNSNYYIHIDNNGLILYNNKYPVLFNNNYDNSNIILSNTFISTSNNIKSKITNLNTDTLIQGINNRFIVNDIYNNNITFTNNLISSNIICSNLTVIGDTTIFNTPIYETEQLQVINDTTATSLIVKKINNNKNIAEFYNKNEISFIISSNKNVGIGTSNPSYKLDIYGSINTNGDLFIKNTNISNIIDTKNTNLNNILLEYNNHINKPNLSTVSLSGNYNNLNTIPFYIFGNNIYTLSNKNIGIGKSNPNYILDINGSLNTSQEILIKTTNISNIIDNKITNTSNILINYNNHNNLLLLKPIATSGNYYDIINRPNQYGEYSNYNNLINNIWINNNNNIYTNFNIGIGTEISNSSYKLDINGSLNTSQEVLIKRTNISNIIDNKLQSSSNILINYNNFINKPTLSLVATNGYYSNLNESPILTTVAISGYYSNVSNNPFIILGNNLYSSFIGNFGIDITNPLYKLDINGSLNTSQELLIKGTNISNIIDNKNINNSNLIKTKITSLNTDTIPIGINNKFIVNNVYNGNIIFTKNVTTSNLIASNLNVLGDSTTYNTTVYITKKVEINNNTNYTSLKISQLNSTKNVCEIYNNNSQLAFFINSNGNIGIFNGNPSYKLDINGPLNTSEEFLIKGTNISNIIDNKLLSSSNILINYNNVINKPNLNTIAISGNYNDLLSKPFIISGNNIYNNINNIGIGISNTSYKLNINGSLNTSQELLIKGTNISNIIDNKITNTSNNLINYTNLINKPVLKTVATTNSYYNLINTPISISDYKQLSNIPFSFNTTNSNLIYNTSNGNLGIGSSIPNYKVSINNNFNYNGNMRISNVLVPFSYYSNTNITTSNGNFNYITNNNSYGYYLFTTSGSITFPQATNCDILLVAAGGNGGMSISSGGGGAGEVIYYPNYPFSAGTSNIIIGYSDSNANNRRSFLRYNTNNIITALGGGDGGASNANINTIPSSGGSGGGGRISQSGAVAGTKWNASYSYSTNGSTGSGSIGGNGGSATATGGYIENITGTNMIIGVGGRGASSTSIPSLKYTYGSGGDGNGGFGTHGLVIIKVPLNISKLRFDGYINYSNIINRPYINDLFISRNFIDIGYFNQINFPLGDTSWANEWFLYMGTSPTNISNSFIFWHLNSNAGINSKWWFNGTIASTNNEISDIRIKKEIIDIINPLQNLMLLQPKEYYICDEKDYIKKYGIIAQNTKENFPDFIYKDEDYIANIYDTANYYEINNNYILVFTKENHDITIGDELKLLFNNNNFNQEIIIEDLPYHNRYKKRYVIVDDIIDSKTIKIKNPLEYLTEEEKINIFVYGKKVNDFLKLDYSSLYCLNIKCNQELYKKYIEQQNKLSNLKERILKLES